MDMNLYNRLVDVIPGGSQILSKQYGRLIKGVAPPLISNGDMCYVWDYNNNVYIDWSASLGPVILGYLGFKGRHYFEMDYLVSPLLPMPNLLEVELAEKLISIIPCAEMVRFFNSGSDATSAAVRLSRAINGGHDGICCGYHGWHDWYASTLPEPRSKGTFDDTVIKVEYGNIKKLENIFNLIKPCFFILEPMNRQCPEKASKEYLREVRDLCDKHNVILIFDEIIMGFRYAMAGGEEFFGVTPDLACYSKAMGNGFPIAALVGKRELMKEISKLQVSGTFYGELNSIKAALKTIEILEKRNAIEHLWLIGSELKNRALSIINNYKLNEMVDIKGFGPWNSFVWGEDYLDEQCYFLQEIFKGGIFYNRDNFAMLSHKKEHLDKTLDVYEGAFYKLSEELIMGNDISNLLEGGVDKELFPR